MSSGRIPSIEGGIQPTIFDAKADILTATAADTPARLAVGANDTVLTADSTTATGLKWATSSSGGMTVIASGNFPTGSDTLSLTSIPTTYNNLQLVMRGVAPASEGTGIILRFNNDSNSRYFSSTANTTNQNYSSTSINPFAGGTGDDTVREGLTIFDVWDYKNTTTRKLATWTQLGVNGTTTTQAILNRYFGSYNQTNAIDRIDVIVESLVNFAGGSYILYGVK